MIFTVLLLILSGYLLFKNIQYRRQMKSICRQLEFQKKHRSNLMFSQHMADKEVTELVHQLNEWSREQKQQRLEYEKKDRRIKETITSLSHDIRTPLTSLDGYFQMLAESDSETERARYMQIIQERILSLKGILEELFLYARIQNETYQLEMDKIQVNKIVYEAAFSFYEDFKSRGIEPQIEIGEVPLYLYGNEGALKRILQNLIKNGMTHGCVYFALRLWKEEGKVCFFVENQVENPESVNVEQIFERFYKDDSSRKKQSTGLGLSIAKELVELMGGEITAQMKGERFRVVVIFAEL